VLTDPYLPMLRDVLATPAGLPLSTVFNVGDIALWLGATWFIGRTCRPRHLEPCGTHRAAFVMCIPSWNSQVGGPSWTPSAVLSGRDHRWLLQTGVSGGR
jgi:hypothetical protein